MELLQPVWLWVLAALDVLLALAVTVHVVLRKEHTRGAVGWIGIVWMVPLVGLVLYSIFGINRVRRKAKALRGRLTAMQRRRLGRTDEAALPEEYASLADLARFLGEVSQAPLLVGNAVTLLRHGDESYPAMLRDIGAARRSITLCTYIFDDDVWGARFIEALGRAAERGVDVKVLIDGIGARHRWFNRVRVKLRRRGVRAELFLWSWWPWRMAYLNLRNHRKVLVLDGRVAFAGGINIEDAQVLGEHPKKPSGDTHARFRGPIVSQLQAVFATDWLFTTGEQLEGEPWFPQVETRGMVLARALPDGPDDDKDVANWSFLAALACARESVQIMTPYFLPEEDLVRALATAALRGVRVDLVLQEENNLPYMNWAAMAELHQVVRHGCRVWMAPGPFDHSKLLVVDDRWVLIGSTNWDERSMRLNFELSVECYDVALARECAEHIELQRSAARRVTLEEIRGRSLPVKVRDGLVRLLKPYL